MRNYKQHFCISIKYLKVLIATLFLAYLGTTVSFAQTNNNNNTNNGNGVSMSTGTTSNPVSGAINVYNTTNANVQISFNCSRNGSSSTSSMTVQSKYYAYCNCSNGWAVVSINNNGTTQHYRFDNGDYVQIIQNVWGGGLILKRL